MVRMPRSTRSRVEVFLLMSPTFEFDKVVVQPRTNTYAGFKYTVDLILRFPEHSRSAETYYKDLGWYLYQEVCKDKIVGVDYDTHVTVSSNGTQFTYTHAFRRKYEAIEFAEALPNNIMMFKLQYDGP